MAFTKSSLSRIGGSGDGGSTWQYSTNDATSAVVADTNYFGLPADIYADPPVENALAELKAGDVLLVIGTTSTTPTGRISYVESNNGTTIVCAAGTVITA